MQKETQLVQKFRQCIKDHYPTLHFFKIPNAPGKSLTILPYDAYIVFRRMFKAIEFKINENDCSDHQKYNLAQVVQNGGQAFVVRHRENTGKLYVDNWVIGTTEIFEPKKNLGTRRDGDMMKNERGTGPSNMYLSCLEYILLFEKNAIDGAINQEIKRNLLEF